MSTWQSDVAPIERVLLKHAGDAFRDDALLDAEWQALNYTARPDRAAAIREYDALIDLLHGLGIAIDFLPKSPTVGLDSLYVRDNAICCEGGMILCRMGKPARASEVDQQAAFYRDRGITVLGRIDAPGTLEGGDVVWLDRRRLAVAHGYRSNAAGIAQLRALLAPYVDEVIEVPLPHFRGPGDVFHLMSLISPLDDDLALVFSPLMPVPFRNRLLELGYRLVEVPEAEFDGLGGNVLAVAPRVCVMVAGNPLTEARLREAGCTVHLIAGDEICRKGSGGPTCLTRPLRRA